MDEDGDIKAAPVTRLRRRLSVESEDTKTPSAPSTPTKKRNTRLAAKPQLELINEHAVTNSPKRTSRKSISRDIAEPEEKPATPARRITRSKSNTSLVLETEEKPLTPARRSARIKSNTSIVSEAAQSVESPRTKRAVVRRNSQVGSDTEATLTPARTRLARKASTSSIDREETPSVSETAVTPGRTRRTRKGSTSSLDNQVEAACEKPSLITEIIAEEPEGKLRKSTSNDKDNNNDSPTRKSPRIMAKKGRKSKSEDTNETPKPSQENSEKNDNLTPTEDPSQNAVTITETQNDISMSSANLIKDLDKKFMNQVSNKNKSMSDIEDKVDNKKRSRTKSWTTLCASSTFIEGNFYSDNESTKKKLKKHGKIVNDNRLSSGYDAGSGDGPNENDATNHKDGDNDLRFITRKSRNRSISNKSVDREKSLMEGTKDVNISNEDNKENLLGVEPVLKDSSTAEFLFGNAPSADIKPMVIIEDSDSNTSSVDKQNKQIDGEDQWASVTLHQPTQAITDQINIFAPNNMDEKVANDDSVEPMDIDETMTENVSLTVFTDEGKQFRKSSLCITHESESKDTSNTSNRKFEDELTKQTRKLSTSVTEEVCNNFKVTPNKSKKKYSLSMTNDNNKLINENESSSAENQNVSMDESIQGKKSRKSSLATAKETDSSQIENLNKSKRKSLLNSITQDNKEFKKNKVQSQSNENVAVSENTQSKNVRKSSMSMRSDSDNNSQEINKSKRKSSLSNSMSHDKTGNENKSSLVSSQTKDILASENSLSKSPLKTNQDLSKSLTIVETNKDGPVDKKITLNYLTSTPVQQRNIEKLAMQMNTSVIAPTNECNYNIVATKGTPKSNMSMVSKSSVNDTSDENSEESGDDEESSKDKSNLIDKQAEDAGEDYESGDSQDEEERQYERENEILGFGETLSSEEDISTDTDYEKDSFIVSSDVEDYELLSGSEDDLDLSDKELTLSAKSKKKYNERKLKDQKNASREMFEARHGLNEDKNVKSKKNSRNRLDSTLLKSDEDIMPPKKNKRMRFESKSDSEDTKSKNDISTTTTSDKEEIGYKKKKSKRLSESNESGMNEKEITMYNHDTSIKDDPLSVNIKTEPRTPQKDLEISRVNLTDDVEHVHVDEDASMIKFNETKDPLQSTMVQEENENSDDDSISENEEIANNYDSVLKELNKESEKNIKSHDFSLNLNKRNNLKRKEAIADKLNLTQTNISKKDNSFPAQEKSVKRVFKKLADTDESCEGIDLQLLFTDESNSDEGGDHKMKRWNGEAEAESFISLKKTKAKTDIRRSIDNEDANDEGLLNIFIDTKGDLSDKITKGNDAGDESDSNDAPLELLYVNEKNKIKPNTPTSEKKKKKVSESQESYLQESDVPVTKASATEKKKQLEIIEKHKKLSISICKDNAEVLESVPKTPVSEKKKAKKLSESHEVSAKEETTEITVADEHTTTQAKKRKRKESANKSADYVESEDTKALNSSQLLNESILGNTKKKFKISTSIDDNKFQADILMTGATEQTNSKKEKKNKQKIIANSDPQTKVSTKRKERDEDEGGKMSKVFKENSFDKVHVPRLPTTVIDQLQDIPSKKINEQRKAQIVSTSNFVVKETLKRQNKPSDFLEETVCINNDDNGTAVKNKTNIKKPKVLPFLPTASTSNRGFTTNFHVNVISEKMEFNAQNNVVPNFKNDYLNNKKIKKLRTYDLYKKHRNIKLSKY